MAKTNMYNALIAEKLVGIILKNQSQQNRGKIMPKKKLSPKQILKIISTKPEEITFKIVSEKEIKKIMSPLI